MENKFKTKYEYCHLFEDKLVFTQTPEIGELVEDYEKSVNNVFKTLMVFFIVIPVFTGVSIFFHTEMPGLSIYMGTYAFFFLAMAFYTMLFTSGTPVIKKESIYRIRIEKLLFNEVFVVIYKEAGRYKRRRLILDKDHINEVTEMLLSEKLITDKDINLKVGIKGTLQFTMAYAFFAPWFLLLKDNQVLMVYYGMVVAIAGSLVLVRMFTRAPLYYTKI